jgi:hypothetical protein
VISAVIERRSLAQCLLLRVGEGVVDERAVAVDAGELAQDGGLELLARDALTLAGFGAVLLAGSRTPERRRRRTAEKGSGTTGRTRERISRTQKTEREQKQTEANEHAELERGERENQAQDRKNEEATKRDEEQANRDIEHAR